MTARRRGHAMRVRPPVLGLTGSIGMGKSAVAKMFRAQGVPVFDADEAVHVLQRADSPLIPIIEAQFPGTTGPSGVDRAALGKAVFGNREALAALEGIMHPAVGRMRAEFLRRHRSRPLVVLDIPLLFETRADRKLPLVAVVSATAWQQRQRVLARPGMTAQRFRAIRALQTPDAEKRARADIVIPTGGSKSRTRRAVAAIVACFNRTGA